MKDSHFQGVLLSGGLVLARAGAVVVKWVRLFFGNSSFLKPCVLTLCLEGIFLSFCCSLDQELPEASLVLDRGSSEWKVPLGHGESDKS